MDEIPDLLPAHLTPPIRTSADLHRHWRAIMGPLGFGGRSLWITFLDSDGHLHPTLQQVDDLPIDPTDRSLRRMIDMCKRVLREIDRAGSVAFLLARPGWAQAHHSDMVWADGLRREAAKVRLRVQPVFLATDQAVVSLEPPLAA